MEKFMRAALEQAELALAEGEIPVGCVFVLDNEIVLSKGHNKTNVTKNGTRHAEMIAIDQVIFDSKLDPAIFRQCDLYVTCEPCIMCAAAISRIGIKSVFYGCSNERFGGNGSILSVHMCEESTPSLAGYNVVRGLLEESAVGLFQQFYKSENRRAPESKRKRKSHV